MIEFATLILAFLKAIPSIERLYVKTIELYFAQIDVADQNSVNKNAKKRDALLSSLKLQGLSDEQKNQIRRMLYDISRN
jgi:hypothetical protein